MSPLILRAMVVCAVLLFWHSGAWAQRIESVRGLDGGVAPTFNLVGPGTLYLDSQGTQGYLYNRDTFQTYTFRTPGGQAWNGAVMTLGPNLTIGLIQGANQGGSGVVLPGPPRQTPPLPLIQSTIQSVILLQTPSFPQTPPPVPINQSQSLQTFPAFPDLDQIP